MDDNTQLALVVALVSFLFGFIVRDALEMFKGDDK